MKTSRKKHFEMQLKNIFKETEDAVVVHELRSKDRKENKREMKFLIVRSEQEPIGIFFTWFEVTKTSPYRKGFCFVAQSEYEAICDQKKKLPKRMYLGQTYKPCLQSPTK